MSGAGVHHDDATMFPRDQLNLVGPAILAGQVELSMCKLTRCLPLLPPWPAPFTLPAISAYYVMVPQELRIPARTDHCSAADSVPKT